MQGRERAAAAGSDDSTSAVGLTQPSQEVQMHIPSVSNDVIRATTEETPPGVCGSRQRDAPARRSPQQRRGTSPPHSADDDLLAVAQRHERIDACLRIAQPSILTLRRSHTSASATASARTTAPKSTSRATTRGTNGTLLAQFSDDGPVVLPDERRLKPLCSSALRGSHWSSCCAWRTPWARYR